MSAESRTPTEPLALAPIVAREVQRLIKVGQPDTARTTVEEFARYSELSIPQGIALLRLAEASWLSQGRYGIRRSTLDSLVDLSLADKRPDPLGAGFQYRMVR